GSVNYFVEKVSLRCVVNIDGGVASVRPFSDLARRGAVISELRESSDSGNQQPLNGWCQGPLPRLQLTVVEVSRGLVQTAGITIAVYLRRVPTCHRLIAITFELGLRRP